MQIKTIRLINRLMGLALFTLCFYQLPVLAQEQTRQVTIIQDLVTVGLVPGQTLSITVSNPEDSETCTCHVKVFDGRSGLVFQTAEVEIAPGEFHSFDIDRADISLPGDPRTGRFRAAGRLVGIRHASVERIKARIDKLPASIELVDNLTGKTTAMLLPAVQKVREAASR
jgi:hypothetical protein